MKNKKKSMPCIFRAWITVNGQRRYAKDYGLKAWPISPTNRKTSK